MSGCKEILLQNKCKNKLVLDIFQMTVSNISKYNMHEQSSVNYDDSIVIVHFPRLRTDSTL